MSDAADAADSPEPSGPAAVVPDPDLPLWELVQTYHAVARGFHAVFSAAGLTATQFGVLAELAADDGPGSGPSQAELARRILVRPQSMGELVAGLVERGLVEREGPAGRGHRHGLRLTDEGQRVLAQTVPAVHAFNAPRAIDLTEHESQTLTQLLRRVRNALHGGDSS